MKKNIGLIVVLLLLIVSVVGNVILANNWMGTKTQVSDLTAKVEELNANNTTEGNDVEDDTESTQAPETVEKYILPVVNPDNENNVLLSDGTKINRRRIHEAYDKLSVYYNEGEGLTIGYDGNFQKVDIGEKMPADVVIVPYSNAVDSAKIVILFTDGTAKYIEYRDCMSNAIKLYNVDIEEKIIAIKQVFVYSETSGRGSATGVAIIEDGSAVEINFNNK